MTCGYEKLSPGFINTAEVEVRKRVRLIPRRQQRALEPTHGSVIVALRQQVTPDVVVRIAQGLVHSNRFQTLRNRIVITFLKTVNPDEEGVCLGGRKRFNRALVEV